MPPMQSWQLPAAHVQAVTFINRIMVADAKRSANTFAREHALLHVNNMVVLVGESFLGAFA